VLAGDSAHVTNTRGGMNMNCGIHDAFALTQAIASCIESADTSPVEAAADERRRVATQMLLPRTDRNVAGGEAWLAHIRALASDAAQRKAYLRTSAMLDMTQSR
jgi:2-polyprenyl-6-methoxyphenol hydroxylase-like FAD-dependent oxidoreductase